MSNFKYSILKAILLISSFGLITPAMAQDDGGYIDVPQPYVDPYYSGGQGGYDNRGYGNSFEYFGNGPGRGYGYQSSDGSWYHQSGTYSGGYSVRGDGSGCVYTPDWSNC